ncbi:MAG: adenylyltransferase/cytidyltransferase family protein [Clostridia bacterium]|nr:adenylyltransferase/cytidyltransferase family protein [Clostridia bacterium]
MKEAKYQRGLYTGAFDVLNVGHIRGIQNAAKGCEQLIVAVSTDEVIREYKHHEPVIPFEQRLEMVSQIKGVTLAIPQNDLYEKVELCKALGVDVIFSCDEYQRSSYPDPDKMTPKEIAGVERWERFEQEANENGIDVIYLPRTPGTSSTMIKEKIVEQAGAQQPQGIMLYSEGECFDESVFSL